MNKNIFQDFHLNNPIDKLLELFKGFDWKVKLIKSSILHKYHWPEITLSDNVIQKKEVQILEEDIPNIDLLGSYTPKNKMVTLYVITIEETAKKIELRLSNQESIEKIIKGLTTIVLLHEVSHWIAYDLPFNHFPRKKFKLDKSIDENQRSNFHEALAQYFTFNIIKNSKSLVNIFSQLNKNQSPKYHKYEDLLEFKMVDIMTALKIMRKRNIQEWDDLLIILTMLKSGYVNSSDFIAHDQISNNDDEQEKIFKDILECYDKSKMIIDPIPFYKKIAKDYVEKYFSTGNRQTFLEKLDRHRQSKIFNF